MFAKVTAWLLLTAACATSVQAASAPPYLLEGTEVRTIHAPALQRDYQIFVSLPNGYATSTQRYPVLFVTDANYAFPMIRSIAARAGRKGAGIADFILVGLSYGLGDTPEYSRRRDYTPSGHAQPMVSDMPGRPARFGEADGYQRFLADSVLPLVAATYRADMRHTVFVGHSYGSLLGLNILLTQPDLFSHYILGSPSLWFDHRLMFKREQDYATQHRDLPANVYFAVGGFETIKPGSKNPRYAQPGDDDMVRDLLAFTRALKSRHYPGLHMETAVIADEDHLTVAPAIFTRGLFWALPP